VGGWSQHIFLAASSFGSFIYLGLSCVGCSLLFIGRIFEGIGMTMGWQEARSQDE
jgi:hypothetical protein